MPKPSWGPIPQVRVDSIDHYKSTIITWPINIVPLSTIILDYWLSFINSIDYPLIDRWESTNDHDQPSTINQQPQPTSTIQPFITSSSINSSPLLHHLISYPLERRHGCPPERPPVTCREGLESKTWSGMEKTWISKMKKWMRQTAMMSWWLSIRWNIVVF